MAEGVGFEPTEARRTSTVFETVPFVRSGSLPAARLSPSGTIRHVDNGSEHRPTEIPAEFALLRTIASVMNDPFARINLDTAPDHALGLEPGEPRPVWALIDAIRTRHFSGELRLELEPAALVYAEAGKVYFAERAGALDVLDVLVALGVISYDDALVGAVHLADAPHLGRLFERVPTLDRDHVELAIERLTNDVLATIADRTVVDFTVTSYRHHRSGMVLWNDAVTSPPSTFSERGLPRVAVLPTQTPRTLVAVPIEADLPGRRVVCDDPAVSDDIRLAVQQALDEIRAAMQPTSPAPAAPAASSRQALIAESVLASFAPPAPPTVEVPVIPPAPAPAPAVAPAVAREMPAPATSAPVIDDLEYGPSAARRTPRAAAAPLPFDDGFDEELPVDSAETVAELAQYFNRNDKPGGGLRRLIGGRRRP